MKHYFLLLSLCLVSYAEVFSQVVLSKDSIANTPVKSNLSYEALTQFFQSSITTGRSGGFDFRSSLFGIQQLFSKKDLELSDYYLRRKAARNIEFSIGAHKDSKSDLNILSAGFKYALINNRSKTDINFLDIPEIATDVQNMGRVLFRAEEFYQDGIRKTKDSTVKAKKQKEFDEALKKYTHSQKLKDLPVGMQKMIDSIISSAYSTDPAAFFTLAQKSYDLAAKKIDQKGLLTLSFNPGYAWNDRRFDSSTLMLQYLKGFGNFRKPWNIDAEIKNHFLHDTTGGSKNLSRSIAGIFIGANKILLNDDQLNPIIEFEMAFEDDYVHAGLYTGEEKNKISLNTILRIHISRELAIPFTLQYDLKHPGLSGFLKLSWNLENKKSRSN